jgi:Flp pilus assembly protein TadB
MPTTRPHHVPNPAPASGRTRLGQAPLWAHWALTLALAVAAALIALYGHPIPSLAAVIVVGTLAHLAMGKSAPSAGAGRDLSERDSKDGHRPPR